MKTRDRQRWSSIDDYAYWNDTRFVPSFGYNYYRNNWYNPYVWNDPYASLGFYNPYRFYSGVIIGVNFGNYAPYSGYGYGGGYGSGLYADNPYYSKRPTKYYSNVNRPNLNGYSNRNYNNRNNVGNGRSGIAAPSRRSSSTSIFDNYNSSRNNERSSDNNSNTPSRSYSPSSSSSSGSSGGGERVTRPTRR